MSKDNDENKQNLEGVQITTKGKTHMEKIE